VAPLPDAVPPTKQPEAGASAMPLTQVTSESTQLPAAATDRAQPASLVGGVEAPAPPAQTPAGETAAPVAPPPEPASATQPADTPQVPASSVSESNDTAPGGPPPAEAPPPEREAAPPVVPAATEPANTAPQGPSAASVGASSAAPAAAAHTAPRPTHYQGAPAGLSYRADRWLAKRWRAAALFARVAASR
jgi:hypothetical protein